MEQYSRELDLQRLTKVLCFLGLTATQKDQLPGNRAGKILLTAIESTLERKPDHQVTHWPSRGWWYHGHLEEQEWVLIKLKFFS